MRSQSNTISYLYVYQNSQKMRTDYIFQIKDPLTLLGNFFFSHSGAYLHFSYFEKFPEQ